MRLFSTVDVHERVWMLLCLKGFRGERGRGGGRGDGYGRGGRGQGGARAVAVGDTAEARLPFNYKIAQKLFTAEAELATDEPM